MREWFKARNAWGAIFNRLTDEQAGHLAKALWSFTADGVIPSVDGYLGGLLAMMQLTLEQDAVKEAAISAKRAAAGSAGGNQKQANVANATNATSVANADIKNKNKNIEKEKEKESETDFISSDEAHEIQLEQNRVLDAAEDAGFQKSNSVRAHLIRLFAEYGLERMLDGISSCVTYGAPNLAYLQAVLKGNPKQGKPVKVLTAQNFDQRDYSDVPDRQMADLAKEYAEFERQAVGG